MTELFIYLIKAALINAILLVFYYFALRQSNRFVLMRFALITAMIVPLVIPLIPYPVGIQEQSANLPVFTISIPETAIAATPPGQNFFKLSDIPALLYYGISLVLLTGMVISIIAIIQKRLRSKQHYTAIGKVELENSVKSPFSFFSWVFLSPADLTHPQLDMILKHEFCHVKEKHSIDRVISGIFRSVLWFSPFAHITSRLLSEVHEYQADSKVIGVYDRYDYSDLILSFYLNPQSSAISNNFSLHTKKRIKMINNLNSGKFSVKRIALGLFIAASAISVTAMVTTNKELLTKTSNAPLYQLAEDNSGDTIPPAPVANMEMLAAFMDPSIKGLDGKVIVSLIVLADGTTRDVKIAESAGKILDEFAINYIKQVKNWSPATIDGHPVQYKLLYPITFSENEEIGINGPLIIGNQDTSRKKQNTGKIEKVTMKTATDLPDSPAQFPGGDKARIEYFSANTPYPDDARKAGKEGTIYVQFVITPTGEVSNVKILKNVFPSLDKVAYDAIINMPKWIPARKDNKPVSYEMTIPIKFELNDDKKDKAYGDPGAGDTFSKNMPVPYKAEGSRVYSVVEETPAFPGGDDARIEYIKNNLKYPEEARKQGIEGTVFITFVVEPDGSITNEKVLRGIGGGLDEIALEVIKNMPAWKPGKVKGEPVPVQFNMPIKFKLSEPEKKAE